MVISIQPKPRAGQGYRFMKGTIRAQVKMTDESCYGGIKFVHSLCVCVCVCVCVFVCVCVCVCVCV
jgi:hypothetical protein